MPVKRSQKNSKKIVIVALVFIGIILLVGLMQIAKYSDVFYQLLFNKEIELKKTDERVNMLLLGIGGGKHEGPLLTDTIIFVSIYPEKNKVTLVSIPRDLWVVELGTKINAAYANAESKQKGGGLLVTKRIVSKILGQKIDYGLRVDFDGFIKAVDMVGGLDINVERTFDDYEYPIVGKENDLCDNKEEDVPRLATASSQLEAFPCRYQHLHFDAGVQHMDGEGSLKFVRSRHAAGAEGTDFARSKRQEKIIQAFKEKIFSLGTFFNPIKLVSLYDVFKSSIDTDIVQKEYDDFIKLARKMEKAQATSVVLDYGNDETETPGLLINPPISEEYKNQWVIVPRVGNGNYSEIQTFIRCELEVGGCTITPTKPQSR